MTLTRNIADFTAKIEAHYAADLLIRGKYYDAATGQGCFIGCLAKDDNPSLIESEYGLPVILTRVLEGIFEDLPEADAPQFFRDIPKAVGVDGKDLSRVVWRFLAAELRALPPQDASIQAVIDPVIAGMDLIADGKDWPDAASASDAAYAAADAAAYAAARAARAADAAYAAYAAARAARAAADAAADAAAYAAARAAAYAADAAVRKRQAATILQLITDAPMTEATA